MKDPETIRMDFYKNRHKDLDSFYLYQTINKTPIQLVRDNANIIVLSMHDEMNLRHAYDDHVNTDMPCKRRYKCE